MDDRPEGVLATASALEPLACEIVRVSGAQEASQRLAEEGFAVVLLDVHTPSMDGFDTAELASVRDRARQVPVILIAAVGELPTRVFQGYGPGLVDHLPRPVDPEVLRSKVAVFIALHELRAAKDALVAQQTLLRRLAMAIATGEGLQPVFAMVAEGAGRLLGLGAAFVARADDDDRLVVVGSWARRGLTAPALETPVTGAGIPDLDRTDLASAEDAEREGEQHSEGHIVAPIRVGRRLWGLVGATAAPGQDVHPDNDKQLTDLAELLGMAMGSLEARRLAVQASSDSLTGLANHRAFHQRLRVEVKRAQRHGRNLALALLDVDGLKSINDSLGHQTGDRVLVNVAARLAEAVRTDDVVARVGGAGPADEVAGLSARLGGDEFALLLPETDARATKDVAERVRGRIRSIPVAPGPAVTVSIGICDLDHAKDADELVRFADTALYRAKEHGRDAVWPYSPEGVEASGPEDAER